MSRKAKEPKPFSRKGLHRIVCDQCDGFVYSTIGQLEVRGLPACGWCGDAMRPEKIDVAIALGVDHPGMEWLSTDGYNREMSQCRKMGGYQKHAARLQGIGGSVPADMHARALDEFRKTERRDARKRQLAAFLPTPEPMPF